jgi:Stage II sporulation protein E (SpoIIE)
VTVAAPVPRLRLARVAMAVALLCTWAASPAAGAKPPAGQTPAAGAPGVGQAQAKPDRAQKPAPGSTSGREGAGTRAPAKQKGGPAGRGRSGGRPADRPTSAAPSGRSRPGGADVRSRLKASDPPTRRASRRPPAGASGRATGVGSGRGHAARSDRGAFRARAEPGAAGGISPPSGAVAVPAPGSSRRPRAARPDRKASAPRRGVAGRRGSPPTEVRRRNRIRRLVGAGASAVGTAPAARRPSSKGRHLRSEEREGRTGRRERAEPEPIPFEDPLPQPLRTAREIVKVVPGPLRVALAALAALSIVLGVACLLTFVRNRKLTRHRRKLLADVGALQAAMVPAVTEPLPALSASVAYRPADGPAAGGDFYDIVTLPDDLTAFVIGDVSGHGRAALGPAALTRYTLRAYLEAGLEPPEALRLADGVLAGKRGGDYVTALIALHDPRAGTFRYAAAGHPAPIVLANGGFEPVLVGNTPPLGLGPGTWRRQTTVPFPRGAVACLYTDGLAEARTAEGRLGTARLEQLLRELGPEPTAEQLIDRVATCAGTIADDAAAWVIRAEESPGLLPPQTEEIELTHPELRGARPRQFLEACGLTRPQMAAAEREARAVAERTGRAILRIHIGSRPRVEVRPPALPVDDPTAALRRDRLKIGS